MPLIAGFLWSCACFVWAGAQSTSVEWQAVLSELVLKGHQDDGKKISICFLIYLYSTLLSFQYIFIQHFQAFTRPLCATRLDECRTTHRSSSKQVWPSALLAETDAWKCSWISLDMTCPVRYLLAILSCMTVAFLDDVPQNLPDKTWSATHISQ